MYPEIHSYLFPLKMHRSSHISLELAREGRRAVRRGPRYGWAVAFAGLGGHAPGHVGTADRRSSILGADDLQSSVQRADLQPDEAHLHPQ